nr:transposase [Pararoseomonas indoligenes]
MAGHASEGTGRRGRSRVYTDAAIQTVLTLKVLYQLLLRAAPEPGGRLAGLDWKAPHDSNLSRRQNDLTVEVSYCARAAPCTSSSHASSASRPAAPPVRLPRFRSAAPSSTPSTPLIRPTPSLQPDQPIKD